MLRQIAIGLVLALLVALPATAQNLLGTNSVKFQRLSTQGSLFGCSLVYKVFIQDHVYKQGGSVVVNGNISLIGAKGNIGVTLKMILNDMKFGPSGVSHVPVRPYFAYLQSGDGKNNVSSFVAKEGSDTPGATNFVFRFDANFRHIMSNIMEKNAITLVYNRNKGGLDVALKLDLTVRETYDDGRRDRSPAVMLDWLNCFQELAKATLKK